MGECDSAKYSPGGRTIRTSLFQFKKLTNDTLKPTVNVYILYVNCFLASFA
jgi:hypothetical protein